MATILNGVPWFDDRGETVNAHGACVVRDGGRYYLFGEYKTDDRNVFNGFSCYSSHDLAHWHFERLVLPQQRDGRLGAERVGERVKVMRCPSTGVYVMFMHSDDLAYKDPMTMIAVSDTIAGEYRLVGPLLCDGEPIRVWDMGTFQDRDGTGYLLVHGGHIYRLSDDYLTATLVQPDTLEPYGESPAMAHVGDTYYLIMSHLTGWDRNDNFYLTAPSPAGPWTYRGNVAPQGVDTWDSQSSFVFPLRTERGDELIYMGDRWSFPHQASCASQVWLPLRLDASSRESRVAAGRRVDCPAAERVVDNDESVGGIADLGADANVGMAVAGAAAIVMDMDDELGPVPSETVDTATESGVVAGRAGNGDVWGPLLPQYAEAWDTQTGEPVALRGKPLPLRWCSNRRGDAVSVRFEITADDRDDDDRSVVDDRDGVRFVLFGHRGPDCGVGHIVIRRTVDDGVSADELIDTADAKSHRFDCYSAHPYDGLLFASEPLPAGRYEATVTALGETGLWIEKNGTRRGGTDAFVNVYRAELVSCRRN